MKLKRIISVLLCACIAFTMVCLAVSCKTNETPTSTPTEGADNTPTEKPTETPTETPTEKPTEKPTEPPVTKVTYTVTVEDFEGNKVSGATIEIYQGETCVASGNTDSKGKFTAELEKADNYTAKITKAEGYVFDDDTFSFEDDTKVEFTVDAAVEYKITLLDQFTEQSISGVTIEFYTSSGDLAATCVTGDDGVASVWAIERAYTVVLVNVPAKYPNNDTYMIDSNQYESTILLADPADYEADGSREETPLIVQNRDVITVEAQKTLYCRAPRTPGFVLTITDETSSLKVIYDGKEYLADNGVITVQFVPQLDENGNPVDIYYSIPNDFAVVNTGNSSVSVKLSIVDATDAPGTESNPFDLVLGTEIETPEFVIGTSLADPGIGKYCYVFDAGENGFFWIDSIDAAVRIDVNGIMVQDDQYNPLPYVFLSAGDKVNVYIETLNLFDDMTKPVSFTANFDAEITTLPDRFTCEHEYDNECASACNKCGSVRYTTHTEEEIPATDATCKNEGLTAGVKCSVCGEIIVAQETLESLPHTPETVLGKAADCTNSGLTDGEICSVCGTVTKEQETIDALGHSWSEAYQYNESSHWQTCTKCPDVTSQPKAHSLDDNGWCACGYGCNHDNVEWTVTKQTSCSEAGRESLICSDCSATIESRDIDKTPHTPGDEATCTVDQTCTVCTEVLVAALGHTPGDAATCTTDQICTVCTEVLVAASHTPGPKATCMDNQICMVCETVLATATGEHTPGAKATCTTDQLCTVCEAVIVSATGHTPNIDESTCSIRKICITCFNVGVITILEDYKPHTAGAAATCTDPQACTACGYVIVEPLGHDYNSSYICKVCRYAKPESTYKLTFVNASNQKPLAGVIVEFYVSPDAEEPFITRTTNSKGLVTLITKVASTVTIKLKNLPDGFINDETFLIGEESGLYGFECTVEVANGADYVYDGRDEDHPLNIALNNNSVTVAAGATIYCSYPHSAGMTMTIRNAAGVTVVYNGVEYKANSLGVITVKFAAQAGSIEYSEPSFFTIINNSSAEITLSPTVA